jgi:uncharacterized membrane protein YoaT (DUF817 family)
MRLTAGSRTNLFLAIMAFIVLVLSIVRLWTNNALLLLAILTQNLVALYFWRQRKNVLRFATIATVGTLAEIAFVASGAWTYANPTVLGVPAWFPLSFGQAGLLGLEIVDTLAGPPTRAGM